jgi:hypothetical protein
MRDRYQQHGGCVDVVLPKNSLTMTEAEILEWYAEEGSAVTAGEPLFLMETEKSQVDVEAAASGTLTEIRAQPGTARRTRRLPVRRRLHGPLLPLLLSWLRNWASTLTPCAAAAPVAG